MRPSHLCQLLLATIDAAEGRRRRRKRDTTPDAIGLGIKRDLLEAAIRDDPDPDAFESWLVSRCQVGTPSGPVRAMAMSIFSEWRLAKSEQAFESWLAAGAPSEDAGTP